MTSIAFIRHGLTQWNVEKRIQGSVDEPLSARGRDMVASWRLPDEFVEWRWFSSPKVRALETAHLLGIKSGVEPRLAEMNWGEWEGQRLPDLRARLGDAMQENEDRGLDFRPEGGESPREVQARVKTWLIEIARDPRPAGAVCHGGVIRAIYCLASGWDMMGKPPVKLLNGSVHVFTVDVHGNLEIDRLNIEMRTSS